MKIDNVIMSVNDNNLYASYWPYVSKLWNHFGINPILIYASFDPDKSFLYPSPYGEVISISMVSEINEVYQAESIRYFAAAVIPGNNIIWDIDMLPCNSAFIDQLSSVDPSALVTRTDILTYLAIPRFGGNGITAASNTFNTIYRANNILLSKDCFWNREIITQIQNINKTRPDWTHLPPALCDCRSNIDDELQFFQCVLNALSQIHSVVLLNSIPGSGISMDSCIKDNKRVYSIPSIEDVLAGKRYWNFDALKAEKYWAAHVSRDQEKKMTAYITNIVLENSRDTHENK